MQRFKLVVPVLCLLPLTCSSLAFSQDIVQQNGRTYRRTVRTVQQPVATPVVEEYQTTVMKDQIVTEMRDSYRPVYTPVTEYHVEPRWHNWWNPFGRPYVAYHMRPRTHWEARYERHQVPVTYRQSIPEQVTVRTQKMRMDIQEREVQELVELPAPVGARTTVATRPLVQSPTSTVYSESYQTDPPRRPSVIR